MCRGRGARRHRTFDDVRANGLVLYQQEVKGRVQLFTVRPDGSGRRQLTHGRTESLNGAWSPDGRSIVFERDWADHAGVALMNADGSNVRDLTPTGLQGDPTFTPDGKQIVFSPTQVDQYDSVWVMDADGSDQRELVAARNYGAPKCGCDVDPTVSPDGKTITYVRVKGDWGQKPGADVDPARRYGPEAAHTVVVRGRGIKHDS